MIDFRQPFRGDFPITLGFGEEWLPTYKAGQHKGIDYGCPEGTPILASAEGTVIRVAFVASGYGNYVIIRHPDGSGTVYAHLKSTAVRMLDAVNQGDLIGYSGNTGKSSGPHLHFEWRREAEKLDTAEDPKKHLRSVLDPNPISSTPAEEKPQFEAVRSGICIVVCDLANVRCHCDMSRVIKQLPKGSIISVGEQITEYNGLPYRDYYDPTVNCWLRIAEHDPYDQIITNYEIPF